MRLYTSTDQINTVEDVQTFFNHLTYELNLVFHPDDPFLKSNTIDSYFGNASTVALYNELMNKCFAICENYKEDIYGLGYEIQMKRLTELRKEA